MKQSTSLALLQHVLCPRVSRLPNQDGDMHPGWCWMGVDPLLSTNWKASTLSMAKPGARSLKDLGLNFSPSTQQLENLGQAAEGQSLSLSQLSKFRCSVWSGILGGGGRSEWSTRGPEPGGMDCSPRHCKAITFQAFQTGYQSPKGLQGLGPAPLAFLMPVLTHVGLFHFAEHRETVPT